MELWVRSLLRRRLPQWRTGGKFSSLPIVRLAAANAGRNYSIHHWMVWQVRLLLGTRSLARAGPSGFVHPRRRCNVCTIPVWRDRTTPANAGRTTGRAAHRILVWCVGCSNHPAFPEGARSSDNTVLPLLVAGARMNGMPSECRQDYRDRVARGIPAGRSEVQSIPCF